MTTRPSGSLLFRVALIADTHVNEQDGISTSPYAANAAANGRARAAFAAIAAGAPAFTIHLGDMIHPVPEQPGYASAVAAFRDLAAALPSPLHVVPGNHDIGDKPVSWMPAGTIDQSSLALYRSHFGSDHYAFEHRNCRFIVLNAPLINSGLPDEAVQRQWLEAELAATGHQRRFMFIHYPPYVGDALEPGSYDNIDEPGRGWLLDLVRTHQPEALFAAHVHNFWYDRIGRTETYVLPSTCFVRHDYAELFRIGPAEQMGRNDTGKLGHVTLEIHETGHVARYHRSEGISLAAHEAGGDAPVPRPHSKTVEHDRLFVDLRHGWAEQVVVAPSGAVDEFRRKSARNDYPLMALWEMGVRGSRVPLQDLLDPAVRARMSMLVDMGHRFQVHVYGLPDPVERDCLMRHAGLVETLEVVLVREELGSLRAALTELARMSGIPLTLSRVNRRHGARHANGRYNHLISHGFGLDELEDLACLDLAAAQVRGVQFSIMRSTAPWAAAARLAAFREQTGLDCRLYVRSTNESPAEVFEDDLANADRLLEAAMASIGFGLPVVLDTLDDIDRGYFVRSGLVDRRFNPRLAGQLLSTLMLATGGQTWQARSGEEAALINRQGDTLRVLSRDRIPAGADCLCPTTGRRLAAGSAALRSPMAVSIEPGRT